MAFCVVFQTKNGIVLFGQSNYLMINELDFLRKIPRRTMQGPHRLSDFKYTTINNQHDFLRSIGINVVLQSGKIVHEDYVKNNKISRKFALEKLLAKKANLKVKSKSKSKKKVLILVKHPMQMTKQIHN